MPDTRHGLKLSGRELEPRLANRSVKSTELITRMFNFFREVMLLENRILDGSILVMRLIQKSPNLVCPI